MKGIGKKILIATSITMSLLIMSCGEGDKNSQNPVSTQPNTFGNNGFDCNNAQAFGIPFQFQGNYPNVGNFLNSNPNGIVRHGDRCYYASDLNGMYSQYAQQMGYQNPWGQFHNSPYQNFQMMGSPYGQYSGSYQYGSNMFMNSQWTGFGDLYGMGLFPIYRPRDSWYFNLDFSWPKDTKK